MKKAGELYTSPVSQISTRVDGQYYTTSLSAYTTANAAVPLLTILYRILERYYLR